MSKKWRLTPTELYFLGVRMNAKYIDYQYIALMPDVQKNYSFHEQKAMESLEEKRILEEDFCGKAELDEEVEKLLLPVFFGETESRIQTEDQCFHVHLYQEKMTMGWIDGDEIWFRYVNENELKSMLTGDVAVQCSKAGVGVKEKRYTASQMRDGHIQDKVIKLLKGEW